MKTHYLILESTHADNLAEKVTEFMGKGWEPHGSMVLDGSPNAVTFFYQPMTRTETIFESAAII